MLNKDRTEVKNLNVALDHAIIRSLKSLVYSRLLGPNSYMGRMRARVLHALSGADFDSIEVGAIVYVSTAGVNNFHF